MISDETGEVYMGAGETEMGIYENEFTLYSVSHKASQINILSKKVASAKLSLEIVFCQQAKHDYTIYYKVT